MKRFPWLVSRCLFGLAGAFGARATMAVDFPSPVDGVVTVTAAGTYAGTLPSGTTKLVVNASGEVTLSGANASYEGATEVKAGTTLMIGQWNALGDETHGTKGSVVVESGATLKVTFSKPTVQSQGDPGFYPSVTISGTGVNNGGALVYAQTTDVSKSDSVFNKVTLAADASLHTSGKRFGIKTLDLGGKTLTRYGGGNFMLYSTAFKPGHLVSTTGTLTLQSASYDSSCTPANFSITVSGGTLSVYGNSNAFPGTLQVTNGAKFSVDSGVNDTRNHIAGPFVVLAGRTNDFSITKSNSPLSLTFDGPVSNLSVKTFKVAANITNTFNAGISSPKGIVKMSSGHTFLAGASMLTNVLAESAGTRFDITGKVTSYNFESGSKARVRVRAPAEILVNGHFRGTGGDFELDGGEMTLGSKSILRLVNGGAVAGGLHVKSGSLVTRNSSDTPYFGESSGSQAHFVMDAGNVVFSNFVYVTSKTNSYGLVVQRGGNWRTANGGFNLKNGYGQIFQFGGTNDTTETRTDQTARTCVGTEALNGGLAVSGTGTVWTTSCLSLGNSSYPSTNVLVVSHGGVLKANRFRLAPSRAAGTVAVVGLDGGILYPTFLSGWTGNDAFATNAFSRAFDTMTVYAGGVTVDTSECANSTDARLNGDSDCVHAFRAPEGRGIATIELPTSAEFAALAYRAPAMIVIEGAGAGAMAYADYDYETRRLTGTVKVVCEGCNYDAESTKVWVIGPTERPARHPCTFTLTDANRVGGGFTKRGANTFALYGTNTWHGATIVEGGTLRAIHFGSLPTNRPLVIAKGAALRLPTGFELGVSSLAGAGNVQDGGLSVTDGGTLRVSCEELFADGATPLTIDRGLTLGANVKVVVTDSDRLSAYETRRRATFVTAETLVGRPVSVVAADGVTPIANWKVSTKGKGLALGSQKGLYILFR